MRRTAAFGLALLVGACGGHSKGPACAAAAVDEPPATANEANPAAVASAQTAASEVPPEPEAPDDDWVRAVREERWADAAKILDRLDAKERQVPEVRYVRARAASLLGDHDKAVRLLEDLDADLPLLGAEIRRQLAEAQLEAGPHAAAARYFATRSDAESLILGATAFERAGDLSKAHAVANRAVALAAKSSKRSRVDKTARARAVRARIARKRGKAAAAVADLRWIATAAPTADVATGADEKLAELDPKLRLTKKDRFERAMTMAKEGRVADTERELGLLAEAPGPELKQAELLHARGWAHYMARDDYQKAAELLQKAAELGTRHKVRDLFYAARARSRAQEDAQAIEMYGELAKRYPTTYFAENARYLIGRLHYVGGAWEKAAAAHQRYLKRHSKKGRYVEQARYQIAVALLAAGDHDRAATALRRLVKQSDDARERALLTELLAVALEGKGERKEAIATYTRTIRDRPLSFAALASAARLEKLGAPVPPPIEQPPAVGQARAPVEPTLPDKVRLLLRIGLDADAEEELRLHEGAIRKAHGDRGDEALCAAYGELSTANRRYRVGQRAVRWRQLERAPSPTTRWTWDCIYPRPYASIVKRSAKERELPTDLVYAVIRQESAFRPAVVSPAGAIGLMQLIPPTARNVAGELDVDYDPLLLRSPVYNVRFGTYYLSKVLDTFGGRVELAAAAYNAGPSAVSRWLESGERLPADLWVARIPYTETRGYVMRVVGNLARYAYLRDGAEAVPKLALDLPRGLRAGPDAY